MQFMDGAAGDERVEYSLPATCKPETTILLDCAMGCLVTNGSSSMSRSSWTRSCSIQSTILPCRGLSRLDGAAGFGSAQGLPPRTERIADAGTGRGKYGYLSRVRQIAGTFYVCGDQAKSISGVPAPGSISTRVCYARAVQRVSISVSMASTVPHPDDIYVVGDHGAIFHFDGERWEDVGIDTNLDLDKCALHQPRHCLRLRRNGHIASWQQRPDGDASRKEEIEGYLWDLEMFNGQLFLASRQRLADL